MADEVKKHFFIEPIIAGSTNDQCYATPPNNTVSTTNRFSTPRSLSMSPRNNAGCRRRKQFLKRAATMRHISPKRGRLSFVFVFYNPCSGGNAASILASPELQRGILWFGDKIVVSLQLYDIRLGDSANKIGFLRLRETVKLISKQAPYYYYPDVSSPFFGWVLDPTIRVVAGGGDGTVVWCVSEIRAHSIPLESIAIGVIPFGTGNDFARVLGWQSALFTPNPKLTLKRLCASWLNARMVNHDLWQVKVQLKQFGTLKRIDGQTRVKKILSAPDGSPLRSATYCLCNYFSIGVESRIGVGFDRYRTRSQFLNKLRYAAEGLKKTIFRTTRKINELVTEITQGGDIVCICHNQEDDDEFSSDYDMVSSSSSSDNSPLNRRRDDIINNTWFPIVSYGGGNSCQRTKQPHHYYDSNNYGTPIIAHTEEELVQKNSTSSPIKKSGKRAYVKLESDAKLGLVQKPETNKPPILLPAASLVASNIPSFAAGLDIWSFAGKPAVIGSTPPDNILEDQLMGDGQIELVTFPSAAAIGFERVAQGRGKRLAKGEGPFTLKFRDMPRDWRVYYQVDGEFFQMSNPHSVSIEWDCKIRVMANRQSTVYQKNYIEDQ